MYEYKIDNKVLFKYVLLVVTTAVLAYHEPVLLQTAIDIMLVIAFYKTKIKGV